MVAEVHRHASEIPGLGLTYEPEQLRFFQARFEPLAPFSVGGVETHALELSA